VGLVDQDRVVSLRLGDVLQPAQEGRHHPRLVGVERLVVALAQPGLAGGPGVEVADLDVPPRRVAGDLGGQVGGQRLVVAED